jgi:flavin reductase (DIM6/NTAB) family NADH-FMN oxidoreductase RutF
MPVSPFLQTDTLYHICQDPPFGQHAPVALVTTRAADGKANVMTVAWTGIVASEPPLLSISVRPGRFTHDLLEQNGDFVVNLPSASMVTAADMAGTVSGRTTDKFAEAGWTPIEASQVKAPIIRECPLALECRTRQKLSLGTHDVYIAEILAVQAHDELCDANDRLEIDAMEPLAYCPNTKGLGQYWSLKQSLGHYGVSKERHRS